MALVAGHEEMVLFFVFVAQPGIVVKKLEDSNEWF